jgi:hypothetical protein
MPAPGVPEPPPLSTPLFSAPQLAMESEANAKRNFENDCTMDLRVFPPKRVFGAGNVARSGASGDALSPYFMRIRV